LNQINKISIGDKSYSIQRVIVNDDKFSPPNKGYSYFCKVWGYDITIKDNQNNILFCNEITDATIIPDENSE